MKVEKITNSAMVNQDRYKKPLIEKRRNVFANMLVKALNKNSQKEVSKDGLE